MSKQVSPLYKFGPFLLDPGERLLLRDGEMVVLTPKVFDTLLVLVQNSGHLLAKDDIIKAVWPDTIVEESNLTQNIFVLRKSLAHEGNGQDYIKTVPRRGYMFAADVQVVRHTYPWPHRLTFRRGSLQAARFAPGGHTVIYTAAWEGGPVETFQTARESPDSRPLGLRHAGLLAVSPAGDLLVMLRRRLLRGYVKYGTLARCPITGGEPHEILGEVQWADLPPNQSPGLADAQGLAVVRDVRGRNRLESPIGHVLYETGGWISHPRFSPSGERIAFIDHPVQNDDRGSVAAVDLGGRKQTLSTGWISAQGLAWSPGGEEVWFTAARTGNARALRAVSLAGQERLIERSFGSLTLHDISATGRVLLSQDNVRLCINCLAPGETRERDLSWFDWSLARDLSPDGRWLLFTEAGEAGGTNYRAYMRRTDGSPAVCLGDGSAMAFSPDMSWALAKLPTSPSLLVLLPTGAGSPRLLERAEINYQQWAVWSPDGGRIIFAGNERGRGTRLYTQELTDGPPRAITCGEEGVSLSTPHAVSPDGEWIAALGLDQRVRLYPARGGEPRPVHGLDESDVVCRWGSDARSLFVFKRDEVPIKLYRLDLSDGRKQLWKETMLPDAAGVHEILRALLTPDGHSYAYTYTRDLSDLYLLDGLK
jgi:DNA-binding winged helix-turn-helix (wHTH) protein/Tol biopolymer transport system component